MSSREEQKEETKNSILNTTIELLLDPEFSNLNTNTLAERAEVSKGSIFNHFGTKDQLILAAVKKMFEDQFDEFLSNHKHGAAEGQDPGLILADFTRGNLKFIVDHPNLTSFLLRILSDFQDKSHLNNVDEFISKFIENTYDGIVPIFLELGWKDKEVISSARLYLSILDGLGMQLELERNLPVSGKKFELDIEATTEMIVDLFDKRNK